MKMPDAATYDKEILYMPWGKVIDEVSEYLIKHLPAKASVLELMPGTGCLLRRLGLRKDLLLHGVDSDDEYVKYASVYDDSGIFYAKSRAEDYISMIDLDFECIICTGGLHHLKPEMQEWFVFQMARRLKPSGFCVLAEPCLGKYEDEDGRRLAAAELGYQYLKTTIEAGSTPEVTQACIDILSNDIFQDGEYKLAYENFIQIAQRAFKGRVEVKKIWPAGETDYGDYVLYCRK